jgi:hypothetical protein
MKEESVVLIVINANIISLEEEKSTTTTDTLLLAEPVHQFSVGKNEIKRRRRNATHSSH